MKFVGEHCESFRTFINWIAKCLKIEDFTFVDHMNKITNDGFYLVWEVSTKDVNFLNNTLIDLKFITNLRIRLN